MVSLATEDLVTNLLLDLAAAERQVEVVRVTLAELPGFEPFAAFRRLDQFGSGYITATDVTRFLSEMNSSNSPSAVLAVVKFLDSQGSGRVSYTDFLRNILPMNQALRAAATGRVSYEDEPLPYDVEYALARLLTRFIDANRSSDPSKQNLSLYGKASPAQVFNLLDPLQVSFLSFEALRTYFEVRGHDNSEEDSEAVIRRLDRDGDGRVSYEEFVEGITPMEPYYKIQQRRNEAPLSFSMRDSLGHVSESMKKSTKVVSSPRMSATTRSIKKTYDSPGLLRVLREQLALDRELEETREALALRVDFTLPSLFKLFDPDETGGVSIASLETVLRRLGVYPSSEELYLVLRAYCGNYEVKAEYRNFCQRFTPLREEYARVLLNREKSEDDRMSVETQMLITKVLKQQIGVASAEETLRHSISTQGLINPYESFSVLDSRNKGYLTVDDFRRYLRSEGVSPTERDMQALMSRYDRDGDAKVTYSEFLQEITPRTG